MTTSATSKLVFVYAALLALLALTVGASQLQLGPWGPLANMSIATLKAALIFWFFMHLGEASALVRLAAVAALLWLSLLFGMGIVDWLTR